MRKHILRMVTGTTVTALGVALVLVFSCVPVKLVMAFLAIILVTIIITLVYKLGDFIGYVFFGGKF